jgi:sortase A
VIARTRKRTSPWIPRLEALSWLAGVLLLLAYGTVRADAEIGRRQDVLEFDAVATPDTSLWAKSRLQAWRSSLLRSAGPMLAIVRVPSADLEVPLYANTSELHLNRGVGLIEHTSAPGISGNLGIAGHRDGFFRQLEGVKIDDSIEVRTRDRLYTYRVTFISIVSSNDAQLLAPTLSPAITLVTCYPFRFVGRAPQRFVVRGVLVSSHLRDNNS